MLSEYCSDNTSGNHKTKKDYKKDYSVGQCKIVVVLAMTEKNYLVSF